MVSNLKPLGLIQSEDFTGGLDCKESAGNVEDVGSVPGLERFPGEENGYPPQYSCLVNSTDRKRMGYSSEGSKSDMTEQLAIQSEWYPYKKRFLYSQKRYVQGRKTL